MRSRTRSRRRIDFKGALNLMDHSAISHFEQKFGAYDAEQLGDLVSRRSNLSDEAVEALDRVLARKGLKDADVFAAPQPKPSRTATEEKQDVEAQTKRARALARWVSYNLQTLCCDHLHRAGPQLSEIGHARCCMGRVARRHSRLCRLLAWARGHKEHLRECRSHPPVPE